MLLAFTSCAEAPLQCDLNPSIVDVSSDTSPIHDPTIIAVEDRYYIYSSSALGSFYQSSDLVRWQHAGEVFTHIPQWLTDKIPAADHIGAPDISYYQDQFLLFYQSHLPNTCNAATGLATNSTLDPNHKDYEWVDRGVVLRSEPFHEGLDIYCGNSEATFNAIDAQFFVDQEQTPWLVFGSTIGGIKLIQLDPLTLMPVVDAEYITLAQRWLLQDDPIIEAPFITFRDGYYYLFTSFNHCCIYDDTPYQMRVGRSEQVTGPFVDKQGWPLYLGGGSLVIAEDSPFIATGHGDVLTVDDQSWLVHHAKLPPQEYRAHLQIRELQFDEAKWPTVCRQQ